MSYESLEAIDPPSLECPDCEVDCLYLERSLHAGTVSPSGHPNDETEIKVAFKYTCPDCGEIYASFLLESGQELRVQLMEQKNAGS